MKTWTRGPLLGLTALIGLGSGCSWMNSKGEETPSVTVGASTGKDAGRDAGPAVATARQEANTDAGTPPSLSPEVIARLSWGSGPSELGRTRPQEGNPEGPMSLAVDARGDILVLDQLNSRILRLSPRGKVLGTLPTHLRAPQALTVAGDGTLLLLDRLLDRSVARLEPDTGKLLTKLPVQGKGVPEADLVTGLFSFEGSVYVEREHEELVRLDDPSAKADLPPRQLPGRPTADDRAFLRANILDRPNGRLQLTVIDRATNQPRYTRDYSLGFPLRTIRLLDSDRAGTLYLGVVGMFSSQPGLRIYCIDEREGTLLGHTELPLNTLPEETFSDFAVPGTGGVIYKHLTESGVTLLRAHCR